MMRSRMWAREILWVVVFVFCGCNASGFEVFDGGALDDDRIVFDAQDNDATIGEDAEADSGFVDAQADSGQNGDAACDCNQKSCGESNGCGGQCGAPSDNQCPCDDFDWCTTNDVYTNTLCAGTGVGCRPCGAGTAQNLLQNPSFEVDLANWSFFTNGTGSLARTEQAAAYSCQSAAQVNVTTTGNNMQLMQKNITATGNTAYRLRFAARSSRGQDLEVAFLQDVAPYTNYGLPRTSVDLTTVWREFEVLFTTQNITGSAADGRFHFWFVGAAQNGDQYWIDNVSIEPD